VTEARTYSLVDSDAHINEPPDLWTSRVPAKFRDRAPHMEHLQEGDAWILEGVDGPVNFGLNVCGGLGIDQSRPWVRWDEVRTGGYEPKSRLVDMDADHVDAAVFFPTPRISASLFANEDPEFHLALVRAYNDWLMEFCAEDTSRLGALPVIPNRGVKEAVAEIERLQGADTAKGFLMGAYPHGTLEVEPEDDAVWRVLAGTKMAVHIHVSLVNTMPTTQPGQRVPGDVRFYDAPKRILQMIWAGVFDRFPDLQVVIAEADCGWIPHVKEQADDRYYRQNLGVTQNVKHPPSHYMERNFSYTYVSDNYGINNRHAIGIDRIMWSSDFPHIGGAWPYSWMMLEAAFAGVPRAERDLILSGNAQRLYRFA
jgi:predicted TIM-barrel fold metal-dependent hydrolase